jgi:acyl-CoA thioesterase-1
MTKVGLRVLGKGLVGVLVLVAACGGEPPDRDRTSPPVGAPAPATSTVPASRPATAGPDRPDAPRIIVLGDSLTAGLGLPVEENFPSLLQKRLDDRGERFVVVNAGVSGDTSAGGLRRLDFALAEGEPRILIVALGGNDGLRGLAPEQLEQNLTAIIERGLERGLRVILAGMEAPPNFGADYTSRFRQVYPTLATRYQLRLVPFLLDGVAGDPSLNQADGIHPNARGAAKVADLVWRALEPELAAVRSTTTR